MSPDIAPRLFCLHNSAVVLRADDRLSLRSDPVPRYALTSGAGSSGIMQRGLSHHVGAGLPSPAAGRGDGGEGLPEILLATHGSLRFGKLLSALAAHPRHPHRGIDAITMRVSSGRRCWRAATLAATGGRPYIVAGIIVGVGPRWWAATGGRPYIVAGIIVGVGPRWGSWRPRGLDHRLTGRIGPQRPSE